jgi:A/G-specific adenine glycosylase
LKQDRKIEGFRERVWRFYLDSGRDLPWRRRVTPYGVYISEIMLQQTQVSRVEGFYVRWLTRFPDWHALALASSADVIKQWQGLGYNRRALWTLEGARRIVYDFGGKLPTTVAELQSLPGIGPNTAASIFVFAYDRPAIFVETNIRRVFLHEFFPGEESVADSQLMPLVSASLDQGRPREWYWALMDYGADLAKRVPNPNRRSKHYSVQSKFEGSVRQIRGTVLRRLVEGPIPVDLLIRIDPRTPVVLEHLKEEGFIVESQGLCALRR